MFFVWKPASLPKSPQSFRGLFKQGSHIVTYLFYITFSYFCAILLFENQLRNECFRAFFGCRLPEFYYTKLLLWLYVQRMDFTSLFEGKGFFEFRSTKYIFLDTEAILIGRIWYDR